MIDRQHGKIIFECEGCSEVLDTDTDDWAEAQRLFKSEGWRAKKVGRDWLHGCPKCEV